MNPPEFMSCIEDNAIFKSFPFVLNKERPKPSPYRLRIGSAHHEKPWPKRVVLASLTRPRARQLYRSNIPIRSSLVHCPCHFWRSLQRKSRKGRIGKSVRNSIRVIVSAFSEVQLVSRTERPKVIREDYLARHRTLVDLILSTLANRGEPPLFNHGDLFLIPVETTKNAVYQIRLCRVHIGPVSVESNSASSRESSFDPLYELDPKIEITLRRLRKARNIVVSNNSNSLSSFDNSSPITNTSDSLENNNKRTLKELATPDVYQPWCIQYPQLEVVQTYELKSGLIHLLPKFHGLVGEDPHKHLKEFHVVCSTMRS
ncbi:hypothetical protein CR513_49731, partial [Mucuna pruriens]